MAIALGVAAMVATAWWSLCLAQSTDVLETLRCSFVAAGVCAALSFTVVDYRPVNDRAAAWGAAVTLPTYQALMAVALHNNVVVSQSLINCSCILILVYMAYVKGERVDADIAAAACVMAAAAMYIAYRLKANAPPA
jgi:hypothetical protein